MLKIYPARSRSTRVRKIDLPKVASMIPRGGDGGERGRTVHVERRMSERFCGDVGQHPFGGEMRRGAAELSNLGGPDLA